MPTATIADRGRMQILFTNYEYPPIGGGGGVVMAAMAVELARRGHGVTVLTSRAFDLPADAVEDGVRVVRVPVFFRRQLAVANLPSMAAYLPMACLRGLQLGRERPFDVINTHFVVPTGPVGHWLSRRLNIPNVVSVHGGDLFDPSKPTSPHRHSFLRAPIASMLAGADAVVAQSRDTAQNIARIYGVERPVELVPLGIARPPTKVQGHRCTFGIPEHAFVMVTVGRLVPRKSTAQLVSVLAAAKRQNLYLLVVGDGPESTQIQQTARELGVSDRVKRLGHVTEQQKYEALSTSDIFVSMSQHEGFGLVFLEAMAFGLPVVCYNRGGQVDFLSTPTTGHVVPLNDVGAFTAAVLDLYDSAQRRAAIRLHNLAAVETYFIDRCARHYESIFESVLLASADALAPARRK